MADVHGAISGIQGQGSVLIVRHSGERIIAKPGDQISDGDIVVASQGAVARVSLSQGIGSVVSIEQGAAAVFDRVLLGRVASENAGQPDTGVVSVGTPAPSEFLDQLNGFSGNGGGETQQSQTVIDFAPLGDSSRPLAYTPNTLNSPFTPPLPPVIVESLSPRANSSGGSGGDRDDPPLVLQPPEPIEVIPLDAVEDFISIEEDPDHPGVRISVLGNDAIGSDGGGLTGGSATSTLEVSLVESIPPGFPGGGIPFGSAFPGPSVSSTSSLNGKSAQGGDVVNNQDGTFWYSPAPNFFGEDSFLTQ